MTRTASRRAAVFGATLAALLALAGCGDGGKSETGGKAGGNAAVPAADPARASKVNGLDANGQPIDAVTAAEMKASDLPPLPKESVSDVEQPAAGKPAG